MIRDNESGGDASTKGGDNATARADVEHGFRAPARRRKPIYMAAAAVFVVVAVLVYLMARPDPERMATSLVESAASSLPAQPLTPGDVRSAVADLEAAFELVPQHAGALDATRALKKRIEQQLADQILAGELESAQLLLETVDDRWPSGEFDAPRALQAQLDVAFESRALRDEIRDLLSEAKRRIGTDADAPLATLQDALARLREALDAQGEGHATVGGDVQRGVLAATREALAADGPEHAQRLLDTLGNDWGGNGQLDQLRGEVQAELVEARRSRRLAGLLDRGEASLHANRLTTPSGDNAADYFRQALALDSENARAAAGLEDVAERYTGLISDAIDRGSLQSARRFLASLTEVSPTHPRIDEFATRIEEAMSAEANAAALAENAVESRSAAANGTLAEPLPDDPEGRLWYSVRGGCDEKELRRYIETYPEGRYIDEAWQRFSDCLASNSGGEP